MPPSEKEGLCSPHRTFLLYLRRAVAPCEREEDATLALQSVSFFRGPPARNCLRGFFFFFFSSTSTHTIDDKSGRRRRTGSRCFFSLAVSMDKKSRGDSRTLPSRSFPELDLSGTSLTVGVCSLFCDDVLRGFFFSDQSSCGAV